MKHDDGWNFEPVKVKIFLNDVYQMFIWMFSSNVESYILFMISSQILNFELRQVRSYNYVENISRGTDNSYQEFDSESLNA